MAQTSNLHQGGQRIILLTATTVSVAVGPSVFGTTVSPFFQGMWYLSAQAIFLYGAGGTTCKTWVQTSLDGGVTWIDVISMAFTTAALTKVASVNTAITVGAAPIAPADGTLADNTLVQGVLGDRIRVKLLTTGTYTGATSIAVTAYVKG